MVGRLPSEKVPELLRILSLRVDALIDGVHVTRSAAQILLCLDVVGQIYDLQKETVRVAQVELRPSGRLPLWGGVAQRVPWLSR